MEDKRDAGFISRVFSLPLEERRRAKTDHLPGTSRKSRIPLAQPKEQSAQWVWGRQGAVGKVISQYHANKGGGNGEAGKQGTVMGVVFPCMANILGVLLFLRLPWIVGKAGILLTLLIIFICCATTFITALSLSAVATNGKIRAGGSYFLISRSLGPPIGAAVGLCFYLGNSVGASMYLIGTVEAWEVAMPTAQIFPVGDINNIRVTGLICLVLCVTSVAVGLKWVARAGVIFLMIVFAVMLLMFIGSMTGPIGITPDFVEFKEGEVPIGFELRVRKFFNGPSSTIFRENLLSDFDSIQYAFPGAEADWKSSSACGGNSNDATKSFIALLSLWFPAVTGIMAGSNRSVDLRNPGTSIPFGTLFAQLSTSAIYLSFCLVYGGVASRTILLNDKFFAATSSVLPIVVQYGVIASTIGAALQSLISAPRILAAIAGDGTVPFLRHFSVKEGQEPRLALAVSSVICAGCVCAGELNIVAPIITMFFLLCYLFVNLACFLLSLLKMPSWRPTFRFYHFSVAGVGMLLCLALMIAINYIACLAAFVFAGVLFRYVSYHSQELNWGDGVRGMKFEWARNFLADLDPFQHIKNWRPQVLALVGLTPNSDGSDGLVINDVELVHFVSQLKEGRGLTIVGGIVDDDPLLIKMHTLRNWNHTVTKSLRDISINGFAKIVHSKDRLKSISDLIQLSGLGGFEPNCILASWPIDWAVNSETRMILMRVLHLCTTLEKSVALLKTNNCSRFPLNHQTQSGTIDIWWVVTDGGLLLLLPFLLQKHKVWRESRIRLFAVVEGENPNSNAKQEIQEYLDDHRLPIELKMYPMKDVFHTIIDLQYRINKRRELIPEMGLPKKLQLVHPLAASSILLQHHTLRHFSDWDLLKSERPVNNEPFEDKESRAHPEGKQPPTNSGCDKNILRFRHDERLPYAESSPIILPKVKSSPFPRVAFPLELTSSSPALPTSFPTSEVATAGNANARSVSVPFAMKQSAIDSVTQAESNIIQAAQHLNKCIRDGSGDASLIVTNLPDVPYESSAFGYMQFVEVMTADLPRVLLVRGSATEVITAFT